MSFTCAICKTPQAPGEQPELVVLQTRERSYRHPEGRETWGKEVVSEVAACKPCAVEKATAPAPRTEPYASGYQTPRLENSPRATAYAAARRLQA